MSMKDDVGVPLEFPSVRHYLAPKSEHATSLALCGDSSVYCTPSKDKVDCDQCRGILGIKGSTTRIDLKSSAVSKREILRELQNKVCSLKRDIEGVHERFEAQNSVIEDMQLRLDTIEGLADTLLKWFDKAPGGDGTDG